MATEEGVAFRINECATLKKFDGDWTDEQIEAGEADEHLAEQIVIEDGVIVAHWKKEGVGGPQDD